MNTHFKIYPMSNLPDAELEKIIYEMDAYHLRIFLYGVARGWGFDESLKLAKEANERATERNSK